MKFLVISDLHYDRVTEGFARWDDVSAAVHEGTLLAIHEKCDGVVCLGDICDPDSDCAHQAAAETINVARRISRLGMWSLWLTGNHDVVEDGTGSHTLSPLLEASELVGGCQVVDEPGFRVLGDYVFICLPYVARSRHYDASELVRTMGYPPWAKGEKTIVLGHLTIPGITPGGETTAMARGRDMDFPLEACRERFPRALLMNGHYHRQQVFKGIHIPGSLERLHFDEEKNEPGWMLVEI